MSKLPRISAHNSDGFKSTLQTPSLTTNDSFKQNGADVILPVINGNNPSTPNNKLNAVVYESKLNEFEAKLAILEEANSILLSRLNNSERNLAMQIKELQLKNNEDRDNRFKSEKMISMLSDQSTLNNNDLSMKINMIQEVIEKDEKWKMQQRERDIEMYKNLINKLTEKVSETVKMEIEARFKADLDNKIYTQALTNKFENEIDRIKKDVEDIVVQTRQDIQTISKECSERTHNVSKYIDQQISDAIFGKGSSSDILKNFVIKLTDQIKTNLISQNTQNEIYEMRIGKIENYLNQIKEDTYTFISKVEERLINKMKDLKLFTELNIKKSHETLNASIAELASNTDYNIDFLSNQLIDTRLKANQNFEMLKTESNKRFNVVCEDLEEMTKRIYLYEDILKQYDTENENIKNQLKTNIASLQTAVDVQIVNERLIHSIENQMLIDDINNIKMGMANSNNNMAENMTEMNKNAQTNFNNLVERINYLQEMLTAVAEKNLSMIEELQKGSDKIEVKQILNEMLFRTESAFIEDQIQKSKNVEFEHTNNIKSAIMSINSNRGEINSLKSQLSTLGSSLDDSGANLSGLLAQLQLMQENEMRDGVLKVMDNMLNNIELITNKEMIASLSTDNETRFLEALHKLESRFNNHTNMSESEFNKINEEISKLEKGNYNNNILPPVDTNEMEIKCTLQQMLNNVEFTNIYSYLGSLGDRPTPATPQVRDNLNSTRPPEDYNDVIDNKINNALEKVKQENMNMWINAVQLSQKATEPGEIRKIIKEIPPVIIPMSESLRRILDVDYTTNQMPKPLVPALQDEYKKAGENNDMNNTNKSQNSKNPSKPVTPNSQKSKNQSNNASQDGGKSQTGSKGPSNKGSQGGDNGSKGPDREYSGKLKKNPNNSNKNTSKLK